MISIYSDSWSQNTSLDKAIHQTIRYETSLDTTLVPGVLIGIWDGENTYVTRYGKYLSEDSFFELGSVSKPIMNWLYRNYLQTAPDFDTSLVCKIIPDSLCSDEWNSVTIHDVLNHNAGLDLMPTFAQTAEQQPESDQYASYTIHDLVNDIKKQKPEQKQSFSHLGYPMLYWMLNQKGGMTVLLRRVKEQNGLAFFAPDSLLIGGHGFDGRPVKPWHPDVLFPSFGFRSNLNYLMDWVKLMTQQGNFELDEPEQSKKRKFKEPLDVWNGWVVVPWKRSYYLFHHGRTEGNQATIAWIPQKQKAVIILANGIAFHEDLAGMILSIIDN